MKTEALMKQGENNPNSPPLARPRKKKLPSPQELVAHYESQGMDTQQASLKAIEDLQKVLFRMVTKNSLNKNSDETSRKLDTLNFKLDSKPGYPQTLAIGIAA